MHYTVFQKFYVTLKCSSFSKNVALGWCVCYVWKQSCKSSQCWDVPNLNATFFILNGLLGFFLLCFKCRWGSRPNGLFSNMAFYRWIISNTNSYMDLAKRHSAGLCCGIWLAVLCRVMTAAQRKSAVRSLSLIVRSGVEKVKGNTSFHLWSKQEKPVCSFQLFQ